ncbi:TnsD family Tn7-like transposition protein [Malikia spinosa]|uniref:Uncharacterized protein n=1 Tax=Malikia spinosa TaxID=86180 RepID=A0A7C9NEH7_9BURK|nr:TniQ family protein [Malikia spinosa]MYZ50943.1 hypothetical protein [Malikia spinosa]
MPVLPKPFPDEVVGSILVRASRHTGLPWKRLLRTIYESQRSTASFLLGENLGPLTYRAGLEPRALLFEHTMFPYAIAFMAPATQSQLTAKALATRRGEDSLASLTKNISHSVPFRRVCKECIQDDLTLYGESYWHRQHMLPGVTVCLSHSRPLFETGIELRGRAHTSVALMPHEVGDLQATVPLLSDLAPAVAAVSVAALQGQLPRVEDRLQQYRAKAAALGYRLPSGDIASGVVARMLRNNFGQEYLEWVGCPIVDGPKNNWPALMVRPGGVSNFAAVKHVLMQTFLDMGSGPTDHISSSYRAPGKKPRDYSRMDTLTLAQLQSRVRLAAASGERITMQALLVEVGAWSAFKHHRSLFPKTGAFLQDFKQSDQSERQLGGRPYWRKRLPSRYGSGNDSA